MAYTTEVSYTQSGSANRAFTITFPFLEDTDIKVQLGGVTKTVTTHYTISGSIVTFEADVLGSGSNVVRIYRETDLCNTQPIFQTGSSIRAEDLNKLKKRWLYSAQENRETAVDQPDDLTWGNKNHINAASNSNWTINNGVVSLTHMAANSIDSDQYVDGSIDNAHLANDCIDGDNIQDNSIGAEHLKPDSVGFSELQADSVNGNVIQDDSINSEHYVDGSIDHQHLANDVIDSDNIQDNSIGNEHMKDDAIGVAELSASGTASSTTFLRGDNTWSSAVGLFSAYAILKHIESSGTHAGASTTSWGTRPLNTETADPNNIVTLSNNQFTLGAGNYFIRFGGTNWDNQDCVFRIYDVTNSTAVGESANGYGPGYSDRNQWTTGVTRVTPTGSTAYRLECISDQDRSTWGWGVSNSLGSNEEYAQIEIYKES